MAKQVIFKNRDLNGTKKSPALLCQNLHCRLVPPFQFSTQLMQKNCMVLPKTVFQATSTSRIHIQEVTLLL